MLKLFRLRLWMRPLVSACLVLSLASSAQVLGQDDAAEEGEPPPEDAGSGNPVIEAVGKEAPEAEDQDFRPDLIELRVAFDDRLGKAAQDPYVLIRPDNDPQTIRCELKDDGSDVQDIKGDLVYTCTVKSQRTQSVILGVFHSPGGEDVEVITRKIKLPSASTATIAFRAPKNYETGTFKIMDPFFFMEPDPESDAGGIPSSGAEGGAIVSVLDSDSPTFGVGAGSSAKPTSGGDVQAGGEAPAPQASAPSLIDAAPDQGPEDEGKNPAVEAAPSDASGAAYVLPVKSGPNPGGAKPSGISTSTAQEGGEVGAFSIPGRATSLKGVWLAIALLFFIQFLRMGLVERGAEGLFTLKTRLIKSGREGPAKLIPDLRPLSQTLGGWVGRSNEGGSSGASTGASPSPGVATPVYLPPKGPSSAQLLAGALASRIAKAPASGVQGLQGLLPEGATLFKAARHFKELHSHRRLGFHLWDGFPLKQNTPSAFIAPEDLRVTLLCALAREAAGRHHLPTLILTTAEDGFAIESRLIAPLLKGLTYPGMAPKLDASFEPDDGDSLQDSHAPDVGDRVALAPGPHRDLTPLIPYIKGAIAEAGALVILIDRLSATGLTDDLIAPERMIDELLASLTPALSAGVVYPLIVEGEQRLSAFKAAEANGGFKVLELAPGPPGDLIEAKAHGDDDGRSVHLEVAASEGWMWSTWQSDPLPPLRNLHSLVIDEHRREQG